jgi:ABC-type phosphate transport system substrate-binding protein
MQIASLRPRWRALTLAGVLLLTACGAGNSAATETSPGGDGNSAATETSPGGDGAAADNLEPAADVSPAEAAERNTPLLATPDDVRDVEVLSVADGSITTLRAAVDGDRPVLLWFWAPH